MTKIKPTIPKGTRHVRILQKIVNLLHDSGPKNTRQILEHINETSRHGTHPAELGNLLSKYKYFKKGPMARVYGVLSGGYEICTWMINYEDDEQ